MKKFEEFKEDAKGNIKDYYDKCSNLPSDVKELVHGYAQIRLDNLEEYTQYYIAAMINELFNEIIFNINQEYYKKFALDLKEKGYGIFSTEYNSDDFWFGKFMYNFITKCLGLTEQEFDEIFKGRRINNNYDFHNSWEALIKLANKQLGTQIPTREEIQNADDKLHGQWNDENLMLVMELYYRSGHYVNNIKSPGILSEDEYYMAAKKRLEEGKKRQ